MHEVGLILRALDLATATARDSGASRIYRLTFSIIPGGHIDAEGVGVLFPVLSRGTMAEGAAIEFEPRITDRYCLSCARAFRASGNDHGCPRCGQDGFLPPDLAELALTSVEVGD